MVFQTRAAVPSRNFLEVATTMLVLGTRLLSSFKFLPFDWTSHRLPPVPKWWYTYDLFVFCSSPSILQTFSNQLDFDFEIHKFSEWTNWRLFLLTLVAFRNFDFWTYLTTTWTKRRCLTTFSTVVRNRHSAAHFSMLIFKLCKQAHLYILLSKC